MWLVRSLDRGGAGRPSAAPRRASGTRSGDRDDAEGERRSVFRQLPAGAEEAARELGVELIWDGPTGLDAARQNEMVESWITRGVDVIAVAVENRGRHLHGAAQGARSAASRW